MANYVGRLSREQVCEVISIMYNDFDKEALKYELNGNELVVTVPTHVVDEDYNEFSIDDTVIIQNYMLEPFEFSIDFEDQLTYRRKMYKWFGLSYAEDFLFSN